MRTNFRSERASTGSTEKKVREILIKKTKKNKQMALSQIKKKRKRKGLDLEAPEVISFKSFDILWATFSQLDPVLMTKCDTKVVS